MLYWYLRVALYAMVAINTAIAATPSIRVTTVAAGRLILLVQ
jgi:hypothetical protein